MTKAARRLNVVQPALSMQIAKLENQIGVKLFDRTPHGMVPMEPARTMYRLFLPILSELASAHETIARLAGSLSGHVWVGVVASVAYGVLSHTLSQFGSDYPNVNLCVEEGYSGALIERVRGRKLDLALVNLPRNQSGLSVEPILREEFTLISNGTQRAPAPPKIRLADISAYKLVVPSRRHGLRTALDQSATSVGVELVPKLEVDGLPAIIDLVAHSDFVSLLPPVAVRKQVAQGKLRAHRVVAPRILTTLGWVYRSRSPLSPAASKFMELMGRDLSRSFE